MKTKYIGLWIILVVTLLLITAYSFIQKEFKIGDYLLKKSPIAENISTINSVIDTLNSDENTLRQQGDNVKQPVKIEVDTLPQTFLIFGDSMTQNLAFRLAKYAKQNGHTIHAINWDSSNTKIWAESDTLDYFIDKFKPTFIFITLGSNELFFKHPESRRPYVDKILTKIGDIPYVWIGPPNWKKDSGINDMLEEATKPGAFFRTDGMTLKRKKDGIHPTRDAAALWMDSIMRWIPKSAYPIRVDMPSDTIGKAPSGLIYLKALNKA